MADQATLNNQTRDAPSARPGPRKRSWAGLGIVPFALFAVAFMLLPTVFLVVGSFQDVQGQITLQNYADITTTESLLNAFRNSIQVSLITAIGGGIFGFLLAYAVILGGLPGFLRSALMTFSGVASNFAGVPLALAFVFTIGQVGLLTTFLKNVFNFDFYDTGFNLYTMTGLSLTYMYFQFPLMILIVAPALDGLKREWREASENLGATSWQYWRYVALPILAPSLLGAIILLFGNAFGAQATAFQLTGGTIPLATIVIGAQIRGDVLHNPGLGYAMAMGMVVIMGVCILAYSWLQRRSERWLR